MGKKINTNRKTQGNLENVVKNAPAGIYEIDLINRKIINVNDIVVRYTGYSRDELISMDAMDLLTNSSKKVFEKRLKALAQGKKVPGQVEYQVKTKNGDVFWSLIHVNIIKEEGKAKRAIVVAQDITEGKKLEVEFNRTNVLLSSLLEYAPIGYVFLDKNLNFKIVNEKLAQINGISIKDHINKNVKELLPTLYPTLKKIIDKILETGKPVMNHEFKGETPLQNGVVRYWNESWYPIHDTFGSLIGFGGIVEEITDKKKIEKSLRRERRRLKEAEVIGKLGHVEFDVKQSKIFWSDVVYELYERDPCLGPPSYEEVMNMHPEPEANLLKKLVERAIKQGKKYEFDLKPNLPSGRRAYFHVIGKPEKNKKGKVTRIIGTIQDITSRKKMEESLIESEERFRLSQKAAGIISWDWNLKNNKIKWLGDVKVLFGEITREDIDEYEKFLKYVYNEDRNHFSEELKKCISKKREFWIEHRISKKDGSIRWIEEIGKIQFDENGTPYRMMGITNDITREKNFEELKKRLNQEIQDERDLLKIIMENTDALLAYLDPEFNFINVNNAYAKNCGFKKDELIGKNHFDLFSSKVNKTIFKKVVKTKKGVEFEAKPFKFPFSNKVTYWNWSLNPILNKNNQIKGLVLSLIDVTYIKRKEEQIKKLNNVLIKRTAELASTNNELEAFTYSASHDLRAPLRSINGFSEILLEDYKDNLNAEGRDYLNRIRKATNKMSNLINDLLKLSRISKAEMKTESVNLSKLAEEIVEDLKQINPKRNLNVFIEPNIFSECDKNLLKIVLTNLLSNAWKFTKNESEPEISFGTTKKDNEKMYYVSDNGIGFDKQYAEKLFIPFQRLHNEKEYPGTGIGLSLVARIIHKHNGEITAKGEEGKGATFYFTINSKYNK